MPLRGIGGPEPVCRFSGHQPAFPQPDLSFRQPFTTAAGFPKRTAAMRGHRPRMLSPTHLQTPASGRGFMPLRGIGGPEPVCRFSGHQPAFPQPDLSFRQPFTTAAGFPKRTAVPNRRRPGN